MKAYKTYQEAKINNPNSVIVVFIKPRSEHHGIFQARIVDGIGGQLMHPSGHWHICKPADHLPSLEWFFGEGHKLVNGDIFINKKGELVEVGKDYHGITIHPQFANERIPSTDSECYVLRADALTKMKFVTESPEEKEALDMIDTTSKQVESLANNSELPNGSKYDRSAGGPVKLSQPEWSGEGLPPVGIKCCFTPDNNLWGFASTDTYLGEVLRYEGEQFVFLLSHDKYNMRPCHLIVSRTDKGEFSKPESPEQKAERERLEAAYELFSLKHEVSYSSIDVMSISDFASDSQLRDGYLAIVDKTGYRKEQ